MPLSQQIKKILIVDDEPDNLESIVSAIEETSNNFIIFQALNGASAFNITRKEVPHIIITDWDMPELSGIELIRIIKKEPKLQHIPIIMCSGKMISSENLKTALEAGAVDFLRKPIDKIELLARLHATLKLSESIRKIMELNEAKDRIFSVISHDLRGPVGAIKGILDLAIDDCSEELPPKIVNMLTQVKEEAGLVHALLQNLLHWSRIQRGTVNAKPVKASIEMTIRQTVALYRNQALEKQIHVKTLIEGETAAFFDPDLISSAIRNLLSNAIKFTPIGGNIEVKAMKMNDQINVSVSDNGVGMPADVIEKIVKPTEFYSSYGTNYEQGSGLGVKLTKEFISMNGGELQITSEPGKGSCFSFNVPVSEPDLKQ